MISFDSLPPEIYKEILFSLDPWSLSKMCLINKVSSKIWQSENFWCDYVTRRYELKYCGLKSWSKKGLQELLNNDVSNIWKHFVELITNGKSVNIHTFDTILKMKMYYEDTLETLWTRYHRQLTTLNIEIDKEVCLSIFFNNTPTTQLYNLEYYPKMNLVGSSETGKLYHIEVPINKVKQCIYNKSKKLGHITSQNEEKLFYCDMTIKGPNEESRSNQRFDYGLVGRLLNIETSHVPSYLCFDFGSLYPSIDFASLHPGNLSHDPLGHRVDISESENFPRGKKNDKSTRSQRKQYKHKPYNQSYQNNRQRTKKR
jgi:hypothetical protein